MGRCLPLPQVNAGAGAGSYESADRPVMAGEPSLAMIRQRPAGSAPVVQASATHLPFRDTVFAAALAVLTVHHWADHLWGLTELTRVARHRVVIVTWDPATSVFWLAEDYFPAIAEIGRHIFPSIEEFRRTLGGIEVRPLLVPHDRTDGFFGAYWRRPYAYLWTLTSAAPSPYSPRSATWNPVLRTCVAISRTAPGNVDMAISCTSPS